MRRVRELALKADGMWTRNPAATTFVDNGAATPYVVLMAANDTHGATAMQTIAINEITDTGWQDALAAAEELEATGQLTDTAGDPVNCDATPAEIRSAAVLAMSDREAGDYFAEYLDPHATAKTASDVESIARDGGYDDAAVAAIVAAVAPRLA